MKSTLSIILSRIILVHPARRTRICRASTNKYKGMKTGAKAEFEQRRHALSTINSPIEC